MPKTQTSIPKNRITLWPISNFFALRRAQKVAKDEDKELMPNVKSRPVPSGLVDLMNRAGAQVPILFMVYFTEQIYPLAQQMKDAEDHPWDFSLNGWIFKIFLRDLILNLTLIFVWYKYLLSISSTIKPLRFNQQLPSTDELYREVPYSICTILIGTMLEIVALNYYASGAIKNYYMDLFEHPYVSFAWIFLIPFWRDSHFYVIHRFIHPWNTVWIPDLGHYLFEYSHYLHHQSNNVTAWSGISMHPIEGFLYETACVLPCFFFHPPLIIWIVKIDLTYKAILGHDGYDYPGQGNWYHYLHHVKCNVNYGSSNAPFDWLFNSMDEGVDEWKKLLETQRNKKD